MEDIQELPFNIVPIRKAYFSKEFWDRWDRMTIEERSAFVLGWLAEHDLEIRKTRQITLRIGDCVNQGFGFFTPDHRHYEFEE